MHSDLAGETRSRRGGLATDRQTEAHTKGTDMQLLSQADRQTDCQSLHETDRHSKIDRQETETQDSAIYIPFFAEAACPHFHNRTIVGQNLISFRVQLHFENGVTHYSAVASQESVRCRRAFSKPFRDFLFTCTCFGTCLYIHLLFLSVFLASRSLFSIFHFFSFLLPVIASFFLFFFLLRPSFSFFSSSSSSTSFYEVFRIKIMFQFLIILIYLFIIFSRRQLS